MKEGGFYNLNATDFIKYLSDPKKDMDQKVIIVAQTLKELVDKQCRVFTSKYEISYFIKKDPILGQSIELGMRNLLD